MMEFIAKEPIDKGWSCDKKYRVTAADGTDYLLRVTQGEKAASREACFRMQKKVAALGVPMCLPVAYGECDGGVYILQSWIEGRDAEETVPALQEAEQYAYGEEARRRNSRIGKRASTRRSTVISGGTPIARSGLRATRRSDGTWRKTVIC